MDFFTHQQQARRHSVLLVILFSLAIVAIIGATYLSLCVISPVANRVASEAEAEFGNRTAQKVAPDMGAQLWQPSLLFVAALISIVIIGGGSLYKVTQLRGGGSVVATSLGGFLVTEESHPGPKIKRLLNIVEEMSLASGIAVPPVYVLRDELGINAFAAGDNPNNAVIGVSQGSIDSLSRDELQGVIAHEYSHILNGDMRTNIRLIGILHGILLIAIIGFYLLRFAAYSGARSRSKNNPAIYFILLGIAAVSIGSVGLFFARIIKASLSRQREFLADASAVQFTRNPEGIANALKKIRLAVNGSRIKNPEAEVASHLFFGNARGSSLLSLFATHPPLDERIRRIDPRAGAEFDRQTDSEATPKKFSQLKPERGFAFHNNSETGNETLSIDKSGERTRPGDESRSTAPNEARVNKSPTISTLDGCGPPLISAAHQGYGARLVVAAILFSPDPKIQGKQLQMVENYLGPNGRRESLEHYNRITSLSRIQRLQLLDICHASLMSLSISQAEEIQKLCNALVGADGQIGLFEFMVQRILASRMIEHPDLPDRSRFSRRQSYRPYKEAIGIVVSAIAHASGSSIEICTLNFERAMHRHFPNGREVTLIDRSTLTLHQVGSAMDHIASASETIRKKLINAAVLCIASDERTTLPEFELIRALSATLVLPAPALPDFVK